MSTAELLRTAARLCRTYDETLGRVPRRWLDVHHQERLAWICVVNEAKR